MVNVLTCQLLSLHAFTEKKEGLLFKLNAILSCPKNAFVKISGIVERF